MAESTTRTMRMNSSTCRRNVPGDGGGAAVSGAGIDIVRRVAQRQGKDNSARAGRIEAGGIDDRPDVDDPTHPDDPQRRGEDELHAGGEQASLQQLPQSRNEE